jgi:hypothetical protein
MLDESRRNQSKNYLCNGGSLKENPSEDKIIRDAKESIVKSVRVMSNKSDIYMEGGNKKDLSLIKLNKIKELQDYSYLFSTLSYEEYISFINIYDTNYLSKQLRIDDIYFDWN